MGAALFLVMKLRLTAGLTLTPVIKKDKMILVIVGCSVKIDVFHAHNLMKC